MPEDRPSPGSSADWLRRARSDLAIAKAPLPEGAVYEDLCFHAQQAAEKAIKAVYRVRDTTFRYTHDLGELLHGLEQQGLDVPSEVKEAVGLSEFASEARYPGSAEPVDEEEYRRTVSLAERVVQWANAHVEKVNP